MKKLHLLALVALIMLGLSGCEKATVQNEAFVDVFIKSIANAQGMPVYAAQHTVISYNGGIKSVSIVSPDGATMQLDGDPIDTGYSFYNEPAETDYLTTLPAAGIYTYTVTFDDNEVKTYTNSLSALSILPANILSLQKSADGDSVYISWASVINAHAYQLKVLKGATQVIATNPFTVVTPKVGIPVTSLNSSGAGVYTFQLSGLYFESTTTYDLQAKSTAKMDITL